MYGRGTSVSTDLRESAMRLVGRSPSDAKDPSTHSFHEFDNPPCHTGLLHADSPQAPRWSQRSTTLYTLELIFGQLGLLSIVWRFPAIALALSIQWNTGQILALNFFVPYTICLALIGFPMLSMELGLAQVTRGSGPRAFAALGKKCRAGGFAWIMSILILLFLAAISSYCFVFATQTTGHPAQYRAASTDNIADKLLMRECTYYKDYVPAIQPTLCASKGNRLDVSCLDDASCQLWEGTGRCIAVPWGPSSKTMLSNAEDLDPLLNSDYPQYCGARWLHEVSTNNAKSVMSADAHWKDYGKFYSWRLPVAFTVLWGCVLGLSFAGRGLGAMIRVGLGIFGCTMLGIALVCAASWYHKNGWNSKNWSAGMAIWEPSSLMRPDIWAAAALQSLITFGLGTNQVPTVAGRSPSDKYNIVYLSALVAVVNSLASYFVLWACWLAYGATTTNLQGSQLNILYATIRYDIRNMPYGTIFTSLQTMFDNSAKLDGTSPRTAFLSMTFWLGMFCLGVQSCHQCLEAIVEPFYRSQANWNRVNSWNRWKWLIVVSITIYVLNSVLWFGCSWGWTIIMHHFFIEWALPLFIIYEALACGWVFGWDYRSKHFGIWSQCFQIVTFVIGSLIASFSVCALWDQDAVWRPVIGLVVGLLIISCSVVAPIFIFHEHDAYGRMNSFRDKVDAAVFGSIDHVRKELNTLTCHTSWLLRLTPLWSISIRWIVPFAMILAWSATMFRKDQTTQFSPYRPFLNEQHDLYSLVERALESYGLLRAPSQFLGLTWCIAMVAALTPIPFFFYYDYLLWMIPPGTPEIFNSRKAVEIFAARAAQTESPVRLKNTCTEAHFLGELQGQSSPMTIIPRGTTGVVKLNEDTSSDEFDTSSSTS